MPAAVWRTSRWALLAAFTAGGCLVTFDDYPVEDGSAGAAGVAGSSDSGVSDSGGSGAEDASAGTSPGGSSATRGSGGMIAAGGSFATGGTAATGGTSGGALGAAGSSGTASGSAGVPPDANMDSPGCSGDCCGGMCVGGKCQPRVIFSGPNPDGGNESPFHIGVSGTNLYFASSNSGGLRRVSVSGAAETKIGSERSVITSIAADANGVFIAGTDPETDAGRLGFIERLAPDGQSQAIVYTGDSPSELALDATHVYWRAGNTLIRRWSRGGGTASDVGGAIADVGRIAAANGKLFYHQPAGGRVVQRDVLTGGDLGLVTGQAGLSWLAADATHVFWPVSGPNKVRRIAIAARDADPIDLFDTGSLPTDIAVDGGYVYWLHYDGLLRAGRTDGTGPVVDLATFLSLPRKLAFDARCVYVTSGGAPGRIYRIAKP